MWTNESWKISWMNQDTVEIVGPHNQRCEIDGGDFEYLLMAICAGYDKGKSKGWRECQTNQRKAKLGT